MQVWPGKPYPLGATYDGIGTNFAVFSEVAEKIELCLFDERQRETRLQMPEVTGYVWHAYLPDAGPGQRYGFRVHGPWDPQHGLRCDPQKLLLDPRAKAIEGQVKWDEAVFSYRFDKPDERNGKDSAAFVPKSVVINPYFIWGDDRRPNTPMNETIIYELHVKGFTARHPGIPDETRGTYAGLAHPDSIEYLHNLGITAVELMPVHQFIHDGNLVERGLKNYWGYNTLGYFAPHNEYARGARRQVHEFKAMVKALHEADIEVILDVVYNHTAEGNHLGPTLCLRGFDNRAYYRTVPSDERYYMDYTGCGNSLNMRHPHVMHLIMDSLRYWVLEMHVDGFRFDLASALARELHEVNQLATFFHLIQQDPVISQVKLIAEPWDVGEGGYQVGNFPALWCEWNGKYRDTVRDFWRGQDATLADFANRFTGSSDLYGTTGRQPFSSINFVTAHDGFSLRDLVSYNDKHNEANGEDNRDGESHNRSWNCGHEGETDDPEIRALRSQQQKNFLVTLLLSQGVPMLLYGDELGRTKRGNNNTYCHDNELTHIDWENIDAALLEVARRLIGLRRSHYIFRRRRWFEGVSVRGSRLADIGWFRPDGDEMEDEDWNIAFAKSLGIFLNGEGILSRDARGYRVLDDDFYVLFNADSKPIDCKFPEPLRGGEWAPLIDTAASGFVERPALIAGSRFRVAARSVQLYRRPHKPGKRLIAPPIEPNGSDD
jgi:glycogen operon protein